MGNNTIITQVSIGATTPVSLGGPFTSPVHVKNLGPAAVYIGDAFDGPSVDPTEAYLLAPGESVTFPKADSGSELLAVTLLSTDQGSTLSVFGTKAS
jgi:hypothetical protein